MARDTPLAGAMFCRTVVGRHSRHRSAVAGAAAQQIVGRRFSYATHDVVRGRPRGRPRLGGARRRRAGPTFLAVQRQRGLGLAGRQPAARTRWSPPATRACPTRPGSTTCPRRSASRRRRLGAQTSSATTVANPEDEIAARQAVGAIGRVENLAVQLPPGAGTTTLGVRAANAQVSGVCVAGSPVLDGSSEATGLTIGGQEVPIEQAAQQLVAAARAAGRRRRPEVRRAGPHRQLADDQRAAPEGPLGGRHARARHDRRRGATSPSTATSATRRARPPPAPAAPTAPTAATAATARPTAPAAGPRWPTACAAAPAAS